MSNYTLDDVAQQVKAWLLSEYELTAEVDYDDSYPINQPTMAVKITPVSRYSRAVSRASVVMHYLLTITIYQNGKANLSRISALCQAIEKGASVYQNNGLVFGVQSEKQSNPTISMEAMMQGNLALGSVILDVQGWENI